MSLIQGVGTAFKNLNFVEIFHLFKMASEALGIKGDGISLGPAQTGLVPDGSISDKAFKGSGDERIIISLIMQLSNPEDRVMISDMLGELSEHEKNGFRQVIAGSATGRTILFKVTESTKGTNKSKTSDPRSEPADFTEDDLRVKTLQEIASMIRDPQFGKEKTKDFLRAIGTLPGKNQWERIQDKMIELYESGVLDVDLTSATRKLRIFNFVVAWLIVGILLIGFVGFVFNVGLLVTSIIFSVLLLASLISKLRNNHWRNK